MDNSIEMMEKNGYYYREMSDIQAGQNSRKSFFHYLPYSEEDEKLGMVCTTVGSVEVEPNVVYPPFKEDHPALFRTVSESRALKEFHIIYITKGQGIFETEGRSFTINPGSVLLLFPEMRHRYHPLFETGWHEYWVGFKGPFFSMMIEKEILVRNRVFFEIGINNEIISIFNQILDEVRTQQPLYQLKACSGILFMIAQILTCERRRKQPNHYQNIVDKAKDLMESNLYGAINLPAISEQLGLSTSRLNEIFKTCTSMTPYQYYIHIKIRRAGNLLEQEDIPVKEAAYRMGFEDQYYFSRIFKNKTGVSPSEWKRLSRARAGLIRVCP
jgi:AraC-like DNA-binding protein